MSRIVTKTVKKVAELSALLGVGLANAILARRSENMKRLPTSVAFYNAAPGFHLNDGSTLTAYAVNLETGEMNERYCGSGCTSINHPEQFISGYVPPEGCAMIFVERYWNGRNMSWNLVVVSRNIQACLDGKVNLN